MAHGSYVYNFGGWVYWRVGLSLLAGKYIIFLMVRGGFLYYQGRIIFIGRGGSSSLAGESQTAMEYFVSGCFFICRICSFRVGAMSAEQNTRYNTSIVGG